MTKRVGFMAATAIILVGLVSMQGCYYDNKAENYGSASCDSANPTYTNNIAPLINQSCIGCHGSSGASAGVSLTTYDLVKTQALKGSLTGTMKQNGYSLMPPGGKLSNCKIGQVENWIRNGFPQ
jgi:mono/diheme cytochrome c family protein